MKIQKESGYSRDVYLVLIASFFYMASPMLVTPLVTGFSKELGASGAAMGMIGAVLNLTSLLCRPFVGNLTDRVTKFSFATVGTSLMIIATVGYCLSQNIAMVIISRIINGIGYSCCSVCMSTWMSDMLPKEKVGSGMGLYGTMNALGMAFSPALGVSLYKIIGYRYAFIISGIFASAALITIQFVRNKGIPVELTEAEKKRKQIIEPKAVPVGLIILLFAVPYCATQAFLVTYVTARGSAVTTSLFFPLYAVFLMFLRFSLRSKFDKWPFGFFLYAGCGCAVLSMLSLTFLNNNLIMISAAAFMAGGYGIMGPVTQSKAILLAGAGRRGVANSTYYIGLDIGMSLGSFLGGILYDAVPVSLFYPCLMLTVPVTISVYLIWNKTSLRQASR